MALKEKPTAWTKNFASDAELRDKVLSIFGAKLQGIQDQRDYLERDWIRFYNMWNVAHDDYHMYNGQSKLYIPEVRKNIEAQARSLTDAAFPNDEFFDCTPGPSGTYNGANIQKALRLWQMEQANLTSQYFVFCRQKCMYGTTVARIGWDKTMEQAFANARDPKTGKLKMTKKLIEMYNGPTFKTRDLLKWYPMNNRKFDFREDGCFENEMVNRDFIDKLEAIGMVWNKKDIQTAMNEISAVEEMDKDIERAETIGLMVDSGTGYAGTASLRDQDAERMGLSLMQVIYTKMVAPKMCLEDEDPTVAIPVEIHIYNKSHVGFIGRNRFWHQRPPYLVDRYILPNADEFYGQGIPQATQYQQYELNSKAEQAMDSVTMALNPIVIADPAFAAQNTEFEIEPAAVWFADPKGIKLAQMPDVSSAGYAAIAQLRGQIQDYSDRAPALPAQLQGKSRSATQSEIVDRTMSVDLKQFQRQSEKDVLEPLLEMWESLTDQYADEKQMIMVLGRAAGGWKRMAISKEMYLGNYKYFWKVSTDLSNRQIKSRQMIDMMKVAGSLPPESQQKLNFRFDEAFRILWKDIMNLPDADKVIPDPLALPKQDPRIVVEMIRMGFETEPLAGDDNAAFVKYFTMVAQEEKNKELKEEFLRQAMVHMEQFKAKRAIVQAEMQRRQQMMEQAQGEQGEKMQGSGNRTQLSPNANAGDQGSGTRA